MSIFATQGDMNIALTSISPDLLLKCSHNIPKHRRGDDGYILPGTPPCRSSVRLLLCTKNAKKWTIFKNEGQSTGASKRAFISPFQHDISKFTCQGDPLSK